MTEDAQPRRFGGLPRLTLQRRIIGSIAILSAISLLAAGLAALIVERQRIVSSVQASLLQEIGEFRELAVDGIDPETSAPFASADRLIYTSMLRNIPSPNEAHIGFFADRPPLHARDNAGALHDDAAFRSRVTSYTETGLGEFESAEQGAVLFAVLLIEAGTDEPAHYVVAHFLTEEFQELNRTITVYAVAALLAWLGLLAAAWMLARRILSPIDDLITTAGQISETDLNRRIKVSGGDEVAAMGTTFNRMLDRLQAALGAQRRMLDDAGHELRTPITVVRGHLELMDETDPTDVESTRALAIDELDRMNLLVQDLILLAKAQRPDFLTREPVELHLLVEEARDKASGLGDRRWLVDPSEPLQVFADPRRITQALLQLASNAYKVTGPGDLIAFGCSSSSHGIQVWVRDSGPGVPPADRQRIWNRFQSGTGVSAGGSGLGLAIVRAIAEAHEGTAHVTAATSAGGAKFIIEIPHRTETGTHTVITEALTEISDEHPVVDPANDTQPRARIGAQTRRSS